MPLVRALTLLWLAALASCGGCIGLTDDLPDDVRSDSGIVDVIETDADFPDAALPDSGTPDSGFFDSGSADAGNPDSGTADAGQADAGATDSGTPDSGFFDSGSADAGNPDSGTADAGQADAGATDSGAPDSGTPDSGTPDGGLACFPDSCSALGKNCGQLPDGTLCGVCRTSYYAPQTCGGGGVPNVCGCSAETCISTGKNCGAFIDRCTGATRSCGGCSGGATCGGGGVESVCGTGCVPTTCAAEGKNCGTIPDGCGGTLTCTPGCTAPETCGGGGIANVCGGATNCTTCASVTRFDPYDTAVETAGCAFVFPSCGGTLYCGTCPPEKPICVGWGGSAPFCEKSTCVPTTCAARGLNCGTISDGCAGTLDCNVCGGGQVCGGGGIANVCGPIGPCTSPSLSALLTSTELLIDAGTVNTLVPMTAVALPNGGTVIAWTVGTSGGSNANVRITQVDAAGTRTQPDIELVGDAVGDLTLIPCGYALLVGRNSTWDLRLLQITPSGAVLKDVQLLPGCSNPGTTAQPGWLGGEPAKLVWTGNDFITYVEEIAVSPTCTLGHETDTMKEYSPDGGLTTTYWGYANYISHDLANQLAYSKDTLGPVGLSDCYPQKGILFANVARGGYTTLSDETGDCAGGSSAELGSLVPVQGGFWVSFSSSNGRPKKDVALVYVSVDGTPGPKVWLTNTPTIDERDPHLAAYQGGLLAAWSYWNGSATIYTLVRVDNGGALVGTPETVSVSFRSDPLTPFITYPNGDVGWVTSTFSGTSLVLARLPVCK